MSLSYKIIPSRLTNISLCFVILMLCFFSITFLAGSIFGISLSGNNTSALTYSTNQDISFTFAPSLSITLSSTDLVIDTLAPGNTAESNTITVSVASNTPYGYALYADVGSNDTESTYYNTSDLIRSDNINAAFTSIATNASLPTLTTDNTWGYSISKNNGTTWSVYNGLPTATSTDGSTSTSNPAVLIDTKLPADNQSITLKVAARSSATQASGAYSNIINFYAVGKPEPVVIEDFKYMQDFKGLSETDKQTVLESMPTGKQYQLIDNRDNSTYWLAKQADDNIWMTQNLDFCIGCEGTATLTSKNTDLTTLGEGAYIDGYTIDGENTIIWTPASTAFTSNTLINGTNVSPAFNAANLGNNTPYSAEGGDVYVYTSGNTSSDTVYNSFTQCTDFHATDECTHAHIGNYYNWSAAIASNNSSRIYSQYSKAENSICPAGWRLPSGTGPTSTKTTREFGALFWASGIVNSLTATAYTQNGLNKIRTAPLFFVRGGTISGSSLVNRANYGGGYWSSTVYSASYAYGAFFGWGSLISDNKDYRHYGWSVRCMVY